MIYFLRADTRIKIGYAANPSKRIASIQTSSAFKLEVVLIIDGTYSTEQRLHKMFKEYRQTGEWFDFVEPIRRFVEENLDMDRRYECGFGESDLRGNQQILELRKNLKLTLREIGERLGVTAQTIQDYQESEKRGTITVNVMRNFAEAVGYKFEYRFVPKDPKTRVR
jgi:DNA-binding XRE family transcriptional regulator